MPREKEICGKHDEPGMHVCVHAPMRHLCGDAIGDGHQEPQRQANANGNQRWLDLHALQQHTAGACT